VSGSRILVTGATGFVGQALIGELVAAGRSVVALVRQPAAHPPEGVTQRVAGPIEALTPDDWQAALAGIDTVIHLAAIAHIGPGVAESRYDAVNHQALRRLADAAEAAGVRRLVFMSSIRAQCGASSARIETEDSPPAPTDAYGRAKLAGEQTLAGRPFETVVLRPVLIVGPAAKGNLALLLRLARSGLPLPFKGLAARRSMVSLADVAAATHQAIDDPAMAGRRFILADAEAMSVGDMIGHLRKGLGLPPRLFQLPEWLLALPFALIGRRDLWQRIAGSLVARRDGLDGIGFQSRQPVSTALEALGQQEIGRR
jgi:nucleoside-diphosphate-sugar epimerase